MKYKLIKEYPGSPELGYIFETKLYDDYKDFPEFWEEIIEKDYEILSFKYGNGCLYYLKLRNNGYYVQSDQTIESSINYTLEELLDDVKNYNCNIHSVKRLSDGEVFTIGDICSPIGKYDCNIHSITKIWFCDPGYLRLSSNNYTLDITNIQHSKKKPLFTTEDDVDIFEGDEYYHTKPDFKISYGGKADNMVSGNLIGIKGYHYFSTKEAAEEYIVMNKPVLSLNDIKNYNNATVYTIVANNLKDLVKSKIRQSV